ncbi:MAG: hypothetical protein JNK48_23050 [Bryobacterales bacterium]|nr:hypothetical protein [Bryobacterales bacterium]
MVNLNIIGGFRFFARCWIAMDELFRTAMDSGQLTKPMDPVELDPEFAEFLRTRRERQPVRTVLTPGL